MKTIILTSLALAVSIAVAPAQEKKSDKTLGEKTSETLDFDYSQFGAVTPTTGYEKLLYDCMVGDSTLFHRTDMVEAAWKVADPILNVWENSPPKNFPNYVAGTWGPPEAGQL